MFLSVRTGYLASVDRSVVCDRCLEVDLDNNWSVGLEGWVDLMRRFDVELDSTWLASLLEVVGLVVEILLGLVIRQLVVEFLSL